MFAYSQVLGPRLMENRKPFHLQSLLVIYNAIQVVFSAWLFYEVSKTHTHEDIYTQIHTKTQTHTHTHSHTVTQLHKNPSTSTQRWRRHPPRHHRHRRRFGCLQLTPGNQLGGNKQTTSTTITTTTTTVMCRNNNNSSNRNSNYNATLTTGINNMQPSCF